MCVYRLEMTFTPAMSSHIPTVPSMQDVYPTPAVNVRQCHYSTATVQKHAHQRIRTSGSAGRPVIHPDACVCTLSIEAIYVVSVHLHRNHIVLTI